MNKFVFDYNTDGFLIVETRFGTIVIEQSFSETSVKFLHNFTDKNGIPSHIEHKDFMNTTIVCMVKDEE